MNRMYVHLTTVFEDACAVGARRDANPVVLVIDADCLRRSGYEVYKATHSVRVLRVKERGGVIHTVDVRLFNAS